MPLPILNPDSQANPQAAAQTSTQTLVRLFHQTELNWSRHLAEEEVLDAETFLGTAFFNPDLGTVTEANRIIGAAMPTSVSPIDAIAATETFYRQKNCQLLGIVPTPSDPVDVFTSQLTSTGWSLQRKTIRRLTRRPAASPLASPTDIKIIPARASFRHARELADEMTTGDHEQTDAILLHLDDPHVDALLALRDGHALATIAVMAMGEVGRIDQLYVIESHRRRGLGTLILSRALEICARALFKHVLVASSPDDLPAQSLFQKFGFAPIGSIDLYNKI